MPRLYHTSGEAVDVYKAQALGYAPLSFDADGYATVDDEAAAAALVSQSPSIEFAPDEALHDDDSDDVYRCGVNDCSREVDGPDDTCWQHTDE